MQESGLIPTRSAVVAVGVGVCDVVKVVVRVVDLVVDGHGIAKRLLEKGSERTSK